MKAEMLCASITLVGMAAWGWVAARRAQMIENQIKHNEAQLNRIHTASAMLEMAMRDSRTGMRHLHSVN